jgi:hypothetical protein
MSIPSDAHCALLRCTFLFALRHEEIDLLVIKRLFEAVPQEIIREFVTGAPTGAPIPNHPGTTPLQDIC